MLSDLYIENGMTLFKEKNPRFNICRHCGEVWEEIVDRDVFGDITTTYESENHRARSYPITKDCCRACAIENSSDEQLAQFLRETGLVGDFFCWLTTDYLNLFNRMTFSDETAVLQMLIDRDPELINQRMREYAYERQEEFADWRCGG